MTSEIVRQGRAAWGRLKKGNGDWTDWILVGAALLEGRKIAMHNARTDRASGKASGHLGAHLDDALGHRHGERLCVGIGDDEVDALQPGRDHVVDGVAAATADPKYDNTRLHLPDFGDIGHV